MMENISFHGLTLSATSSSRLKLGVSNSSELVLSGTMGRCLDTTNLIVDRNDANEITIKINYCNLNIKFSRFASIGQLYDVTWTAKYTDHTKLMDQFHMDQASWYGVGQIRKQQWPINKWQRDLRPFVAGDSYKEDYGGVQERYFLSSNGVAILVDNESPLFVAINNVGNNMLTLCSMFEGPYKLPTGGGELSLRYTIYQASNIKAVHQLVFQSGSISAPAAVPDATMFEHPIWTTWARYKRHITHNSVLKFAQDIKSHGFKASQLEIDDKWSPQYGDMVFDTEKFPDPRTMIKKVKELGHRVTLWVHPFCSLGSEASRHPYWVRGDNDGVVIWWNGLGKSLDVTNHNAVKWFKASLKSLRDTLGITSFKFDAGELTWLPSNCVTTHEMSTPNEYTAKWARIACDSDEDVRCQEVRVGVRTQHLPLFVRMMDKDSNWGYENGLRTLIPHSLTFSILGYPFILPDIIGGNAYDGHIPDKELYVRWLQASVFMPALQFSICPWQYDEEVIKISKSMVDLHTKFSNRFLSLAKQCVQTGDPIIRPLWWIAPNDHVAQTIDSEFLVGDDLLVAPVLVKGAVSRHVYLPQGVWRDGETGCVMQGGRWYEHYSAPLECLPYFMLVNGTNENQKSPLPRDLQPDYLKEEEQENDIASSNVEEDQLWGDQDALSADGAACTLSAVRSQHEAERARLNKALDKIMQELSH